MTAHRSYMDASMVPPAPRRISPAATHGNLDLFDATREPAPSVPTRSSEDAADSRCRATSAACSYCGGVFTRTPGQHGPSCSLECRFWAKVDKDGPVHPVLGTRCWVWTGSTTGGGYGQVKDGTHRARKTHRLSWGLVNGSIPPGLFVLHRCDNPPCVNPSHLFLGTMADNVHDRDKKGRASEPPGAAERRAATRCKHGHGYTSDNTAWRKGRNGCTYRGCRACVRARSAKRRAISRRVPKMARGVALT